jgi:hypothetical protein
VRLFRSDTRSPASATRPIESLGQGGAGATMARANTSQSVVQSAVEPVHGAPMAIPVTPREPPSDHAPATVPRTSAAPPMPSGLDNELHLRAELAIETFRSSFDAALAEQSPLVCERLRQAATDLMRVAARTTMVLDRLNAITDRSTRSHYYPRSAHASEDSRKS